MSIKLKIEKILPLQNRGHYLFVRTIEPEQNFRISNKSFIDNVELDNYLDIPRKLKENGEMETNLFTFRIKNIHEIHRLKENTVVELIPGDKPCVPPWHFTNKELAGQLNIEIDKGHILYGKDIKTIARRQDNDDVLFGVFEADFKYAMVHLTWSQVKLSNSDIPKVKTYIDWDDVHENLFIPSNMDFE
jgi:hypothetical protein